MDARIRARVWERAGNRCEYCQLQQADSPLAPLHIEHILPKAHGGSEDLDNLALACIDGNLLNAAQPQTRSVMATKNATGEWAATPIARNL